MNYPKISIVTVNYNKAKYLERTILSVLSQNYPNLEYVIIDGGSTDGSVEIIQKYAQHLAFWVSEPDKGMYDALRKGFEHTSGEIMAWINSDDMYHRNAFFNVAEIFSSDPDIEWLEGALTHWDEQDRCVYVSKSRYLNRVKFLMGDMKYIQQESTFWRRSLYDKADGIDTCYKLAGDFALWMKFSRHAKLYIANALLGGFRISNDGQLSDNFDGYMREVDNIIAAETVDELSAKEISYIRQKEAMIQKLSRYTRGWINAEKLRKHYFRKQDKEEREHTIVFGKSNYSFRTIAY